MNMKRIIDYDWSFSCFWLLIYDLWLIVESLLNVIEFSDAFSTRASQRFFFFPCTQRDALSIRVTTRTPLFNALSESERAWVRSEKDEFCFHRLMARFTSRKFRRWTPSHHLTRHVTHTCVPYPCDRSRSSPKQD